MNPALLELLKEVVVPLVTSFFHEFFNQNGRLPTNAEVKEHLDGKSAVITMQSDALGL